MALGQLPQRDMFFGWERHVKQRAPIPDLVVEQTPFSLQTGQQPATGKWGQDRDLGLQEFAGLDEVAQLLEDTLVVAVIADDEAAVDRDSVVLDLLDGVEILAAGASVSQFDRSMPSSPASLSDSRPMRICWQPA